jgi:DNA-binding MarR family transcriptional regulator
MHSQLLIDDPLVPGPLTHEWSRLALLASALDSSLDKWLADTYRIGLTELRALGFLSQASDKELRVNDLAQKIGLNPSSTTRLVSRLEGKGYARRDLCADDGRGVYAVIDGRGEELLRTVRDPYESRLQLLLGDLGTHLPHLDSKATVNALSAVGGVIAA